jgi:hypothetical protein
MDDEAEERLRNDSLSEPRNVMDNLSPVKGKVMYMIVLKSLLPTSCTKDEADNYADWVCDYIMDLADLPCGSHAEVLELDHVQVQQIFPHYDEADDQADENEDE